MPASGADPLPAPLLLLLLLLPLLLLVEPPLLLLLLAVPLLLPLAPLLLPLALTPLVHWPLVQLSEQHSPYDEQLELKPLQDAPVPPQTPLAQSALQQSPLPVQDSPSALQVGAEVGLVPSDETQTPWQDRLQQSLHCWHVAPPCPQEPLPPSPNVSLSNGPGPALPHAVNTTTKATAPNALVFIFRAHRNRRTGRREAV